MQTELMQARWCNVVNRQLVSFAGVQPIQMAHSDGTALPLVLADAFGADVIRFEGGRGVRMHTHPGAHILVVTKGTGFLPYCDKRYPLSAGMIYLVPSHMPHAIEAETELVMLSIGNNHQPAGSERRLTIVGG